MIKVIRRNSDGRYLKAVDGDVWVDNVNDAYEMTYRECENAKNTLSNTYTSEDIKEILNFRKTKALSEEEIEEIRTLLKNKQ